MAILTYLLDTSVLIAHLRGSNSKATEWVTRAAKDNTIRCAASSLTYYELSRGAIDPVKTRQYKMVFRPIKIYAVTKEVAEMGARFYLALPTNQRIDKINSDILIAATAECLRFPIITLNQRDFSRFALTVQLICLNN